MALSDKIIQNVSSACTEKVVEAASEGTSAILKTKRTITIKIHNATKLTLKHASIYFLCGAADETIQERLEPGQSTIFHARKAAGPITSGVVGVVGYRIAEDVTVAIYFRVPYYNYMFKENKWNVMLVEESMVNKDTYKKLITSWIPGDASWFENRKLENPKSFEGSLQLSYSGSMSPSSRSTLEVWIEDASRTDSSQ